MATDDDKKRNGHRAGDPRAAFLLYPGLSPLDLLGPLTVLSAYFGRRVVFVGEKPGPMSTDASLQVVADVAFDEVPEPRGLVVPGGGPAAVEAAADSALVRYVAAAGSAAEFVAAVRTGSLLLASAGLLRGRRATTHFDYRDLLEGLGGRYQRNPWVEDGKFLTADGVSGGIDMSLQLMRRLAGDWRSRFTQIVIEYDPHPPLGAIDWARVSDDGRVRLSSEEWQELLDHSRLDERLSRLVADWARRHGAPSENSASAPAPVELLPGHDHVGELPPIESETKLVALVLYPGLTALDLAGPLQVLATLNRFRPEFRPVVVGEQLEPLESDSGLKLVPERSFAEVPAPEVLLVPGGGAPTLRAMNNEAIREYVRTSAQTASAVMSVCTGALILAAVGLREGRPATTHWAYREVLESLGARYVQTRWVEDGKFLHSAGVSAGIDAALQLVRRLTDDETARQVQLVLGYDPQPPMGGIDYQHLGVVPRTIRAGFSVAAPFLARKPKQLTRAGR